MTNITEDYVSFETAKLLKENGFPQEYDIHHAMVYNEEDYEYEYEVQRMVTEIKLVKAGTLSSYPASVPEPRCYCPTHQMAMKWLREIHNYIIAIDYDSYENADDSGVTIGYSFSLQKKENPSEYEYIHDWAYDTYEEAAEEAIKYCLINLLTKIEKQQNNESND